MPQVIKSVKDSTKKSVKKGDIGLLGIITIFSQISINSFSNKDVMKELLATRDQISLMRVEREMYFVRKDDLTLVKSRLDELDKTFNRVDLKLASIDHYLRKNRDYFTSLRIRDSAIVPASANYLLFRKPNLIQKPF